MRQGCLIHAVGRVRSKIKISLKRKKKNEILPHSRDTANTQKPAPQKRSSTATAANSRRLATKQVPRVVAQARPLLVDAGFVGIGQVQLSQSSM